jgi:hypothetical protein
MEEPAETSLPKQVIWDHIGVLEEEDEIARLLNDEGLNEEVQKWAYDKNQSNDKMVVNIFRAFKKNKDRDDFIDSLNRLYKK